MIYKTFSERRTMKTFLCLLSVAVYATVAVPVEDVENSYRRFVEVKDDDGNLHVVDLKAQPNMDPVEQMERNPNNNEYYLFTRRNPTTPQRLFQNMNSIFSSNFNARNPTVISVHGWMGSLSAANNEAIRNAYLNKGDVNVLVMDWRELASQEYLTAVAGIPAVGRGLGQFLTFLSGVTGATFSTFHLVGFSLGAHVAGNAGRQLNGRAARVTGLDPAGAPWDTNPLRIRKGDGIYVEGIHTDTGPSGLGIGFLTPIGDADFYPNGGVSQPGCNSTSCNHNRAWELFAATVTHNHLVGRLCADISEVVADTCRGLNFNMGNDDLTKWGAGIYRLNTGSQYPF